EGLPQTPSGRLALLGEAPNTTQLSVAWVQRSETRVTVRRPSTWQQKQGKNDVLLTTVNR
ncbi:MULTISPECIES: hypothetical protein, partial [unclassified Legionella]|uniref:hypothetical protein n=1 Tax=unclassified Legionella TaxID=2622702 RepID=UPI003AF856E7